LTCPRPAFDIPLDLSDILNCWNGIGTQIDGLGRIGVGDRLYNGYK
jgi:hypothetical protein